MKRSIREVVRVLLAVAVLSGGMQSGVSDGWGQEKGSTLAGQMQGSWNLVSIYNEQDGKRIDIYGPNPKGFMVLTPDGRFIYLIMRASLPKFAANNRMKGTAEENQAVIQGSHATFGKYTVASDKTVNFHIEGSTFPNWDGQDQKRVMTVSGDELKVTNPHATTSGTNHIIWKRAK